VRKLFFDVKKMSVDAHIHELGVKLGEELLKPTRIYVRAFMALSDHIEIKGMAHITGGGIPGNLPRILPEGICAHIRIGSWPVPPIFEVIVKIGNIADEEMKMTFNMGIGYIMVVSKKVSDDAISLLNEAGYRAFIIGNTEKGGRGVRYS
jgi:phosphoribosylformylglycinamidine cyclo-ligase